MKKLFQALFLITLFANIHLSAALQKISGNGDDAQSQMWKLCEVGGSGNGLGSLLKDGANPDVSKIDGWMPCLSTPLILACCHGNTEMALALLKNNIDPNCQDYCRSTALMRIVSKYCSVDKNDHALKAKYLEVINVLVMAETDLGTRNSLDKTAADIARENGATELLKLLEPLGG